MHRRVHRVTKVHLFVFKPWSIARKRHELFLCTYSLLPPKHHVIRGRLPAIGRPNAEILHHGPPPAYARGRAAVGGTEPWLQVHPGILRGARAAAGL